MSPSFEDPELNIEVLSHFSLSTGPLKLAKWGDEPTRGLMSPSYDDAELGIVMLRWLQPGHGYTDYWLFSSD